MLKKTASHLWIWLVLPVLLFTLVVAALAHPAAASARTAGGARSQPLAAGQLFTGGKSHLKQDATWVKLKLTFKIGVSGSKTHRAAAAYPAADLLDTTFVRSISEPPYTGSDAAGHGYTDEYIWNFCGPGASTVSMDYWPNVNNRAIGGHYYSDPHATTYWNDNNDHAYIMYMATQVWPPSFGSGGQVTYLSYPNAYTTFNDLRDAMNWEASNHNTSTWSTFFYVSVGASSMSSSTMRSYIMSDVAWAKHPAVVSVNDDYLPDWHNIHTSHFVSIIGYDNNAGTYTYVETCGKTSCGTNGTGIYTISQQQLYNGVENDNGNGGIVW
ncbi:MAG: hypothetical protein H0W02_23645 [Ktedonobacteraceae bacterium]|nr:hypothetical protein [Ktedonobacteraceae bacterium]